MINEKFMVKFNGGNPVVICSNCRKIIRDATTNEVFSLQTFPPEYCEECKLKEEKL